MIKKIRLYPFGFIFTDEKLILRNLPQSYVMKKIIGEYYYYYDPKDEHRFLIHSNKFIIINGHFTHVGIENSFNDEELLEKLLYCYHKHYNEFLNLIDFIGGRYAIIIGDNENVEVFQDATGARSIYYMSNYNVVSTHLNLIKDNFNLEDDTLLYQLNKIKYSFFSTPYLNVKNLIPNHSLRFKDKSVKRFYPRVDNRFVSLEEDQKFEIAEKLWKGQLKDYNEKYDELILSLTGGHDSRVLLAMSKEYKNKINYFTYSVEKNINNSKFEKTAKLDEYIVKQIKNDIDINHKFIYIKDNQFSLSNAEEQIINKNTIKKHGRKLISFYNSFFPKDNTMHIRGNLLEIGRAIFYDGTKPTDRIKKHVLNKLKKRCNINSFEESTIYQNINKAIKELSYDREKFKYNQLDLYYWEIHMGQWFSEVLNETDSSFNTFLPFNMRAIIDISLSFSLEKRRNEYFFNELINRNYPILNFYGKNEKENLYEKSKKRTVSFHENEDMIFFKSIRLYNKENNFENIYKSHRNIVYIPASKFTKGCYSEATIVIENNKSMVTMILQSAYYSKKAEGYLQYEILKNDLLLLTEDMSKWSYKNHINIYNLNKGDKLKIRVKGLRTAKAKSWQVASKLQLINYKEIEIEKDIQNKINCSSPYSIIKV